MMQALTLAVLLTVLQTSSVPQGISEFNRGDLQAARRDLERGPATPESAVFLALTRAGLGECDGVTPELEKRFQAPSSSGDAKQLHRLAGLALAQCHMSAKRFTAASPVIAQLEREFPTDADVLYLSASFHQKAWNDSIYRLYQNAPASYRVDQISAEVFETQGRYTEAIAEYRKAIEKNPKAINLHYRLARAMLQQSHDATALDLARKEFAAELALNPFDAVAEYQAAQILLAQGKPADAAPYLERAVQSRPDFPEALIAVAKLRSEAKRYPEAIAFLERAIKQQPRNESAHYNLMIAYRNAGRDADAQREKGVIDKLQRPPEGEFTDFLKRLGEKAPLK